MRRCRTGALRAALVLSAMLADMSCRVPTKERSADGNKETAMDQAILKMNVTKADIVILASVESVGAPPGFWSGLIPAFQQVHYRAIRYIKKRSTDMESSVIVVFHPIVAKSLTSKADAPMLRKDLFAVGTKLILFVREQNSRYETFDENYGVVSDDNATLAIVDTR